MDIFDPSTKSEGGAAQAALLADDLIEHAVHALDTHTAKVRTLIEGLSREELDLHYRTALKECGKRPWRFLALSLRYTELGIPPALRPWPDDFAGLIKRGEVPTKALAIADLMWLFTRHPRHRPEVRQWRRLFDGQARHHDALNIANRFTSSGLLARRLAATSDMRSETLTVRPGGTAWIRPYLAHSARMVEALEREQARRNGRQMRQGQHHRQGTHQRRYEVWRCGQACDESPAATARLYTAVTGNPMTRQLAGKLLDEARQDSRAFERRNAEVQ